MTRRENQTRPRRESLKKRIGIRRHRALMARGQHRCVYCGACEGPLHLDHAIPRCTGGLDDESNLVVACASCNCQRHSLPLTLWSRYLRVALGWTAPQTTAMLRRVRAQLAR